MLWVLKRTVSTSSFEPPKHIYEIIYNFTLKDFVYLKLCFQVVFICMRKFIRIQRVKIYTEDNFRGKIRRKDKNLP